MITEPLRSSTRAIEPKLSALLTSLRPSDRIRVTQTIRVGSKKWPTVVEGTFRALNYLATGLATDRVPDDDVIVVVVHFTKDNGEMSSITLDDETKVEKIA